MLIKQETKVAHKDGDVALTSKTNFCLYNILLLVEKILFQEVYCIHVRKTSESLLIPCAKNNCEL